MVITLCASMSFYKHCIEIADELASLHIEALVPDAAFVMKKDNNYDIQRYVRVYYNNNLIQEKPTAIKRHFDKIAKGDAILVINDEKHGIANYIGPNVLMEMGLAFYLNKPIYIFSELPKESPFIEELQSMKIIPLYGNLRSIKSYVK